MNIHEIPVICGVVGDMLPGAPVDRSIIADKYVSKRAQAFGHSGSLGRRREERQLSLGVNEGRH